MIYTMNHEIKPFTQALLTKSELAWLVGKIQVSKVYEYRIKSDIKKKLQTFQKLELPLLMERGFISPSNYNNSLSVYIQNLSANPQINLIGKEARIEPFKTKQGSLGRDLDPGPLPYQGNDVRFIDLAAIKLVAVAAISPFTGGVAFAFLLYIAGIVITFVVKNTKAVGITLLVIGVIAMAITNLWGIIPFALLLPAGIVALRYNPYRQ